LKSVNNPAYSGLKKQDLIDHVEIVGSSKLNDHILNADAVLSF
jgi:predicted peroxiredoxin